MDQSEINHKKKVSGVRPSKNSQNQQAIELYTPSAEIVSSATIQEFDNLYKRSIQDPQGFWADRAEELDLEEGKRLARQAVDLIQAGTVGYVLITARKE